MKTKIFFFFALACMVAGQVFSQRQNLKPYGLKCGKIEYKFSGAQEGVGIMYFDDFGLRSNMFLDAIEGNKHHKGYTLTLGEYQYMYDLEKSIDGVKMKNPIFREINDRDNMETILAKVYGKMGLEKAGIKTFLERECDLWKGEQGEALIWNGILLKLDLNRYGNIIHQEATSIKINVLVDPSLFEIPAGIEFMEMPGFNF